MGPNEPFWRTNSSFSPPLSRNWDYQLQSEGLAYESNDDGVVSFDGSSVSSNSKESRRWVNVEQVHDDRYLPFDGGFSYFNSPTSSYQNQQLMPPTVQGVSINDYVRESSSVPRTFSRIAEGTSRVPESVGSFSSRSDDSEYEPASKTHTSSHRSFSSCCSFMSKPIHPFSLSEDTFEEGETYGSLNVGGTPQRETSRWSGNSSTEFTDVSGLLEAECLNLPHKPLYGGSRCELCCRFLFQRSPWDSCRIVSSGDMPITSVLSCWHAFHAECLEQISPKPQKHDPPCPICEKSENGHGVEQWAICRLKNGLPRLRSLGEAGPSRVWSCGQIGDCLDGAIDAPKRSSSMLLRNRSRKRQLSLKGNSGKDKAENSKRSGLCSPQVSLGAVGCSSLVQGPSLKRW